MAYLDKTDKKKNDTAKVSILERIKNRYKGIRSELRKVIWPDRKHFKLNLVTVLAIILGSALIIFAFDSLVGFVLHNIGFYNAKESVQSIPAVTAEATVPSGSAAPDQTIESSETEAAETAEASTAESGN